jgi:hypothetical protein
VSRQPNPLPRDYALEGTKPCTDLTDLFFQSDPTPALNICRQCPLRGPCRTRGDRTESPDTTQGVLGGETADMRIERRRRQRRRAA